MINVHRRVLRLNFEFRISVKINYTDDSLNNNITVTSYHLKLELDRSYATRGFLIPYDAYAVRIAHHALHDQTVSYKFSQNI